MLFRSRDWWHGHPFSISAAPSGQALRFTVREYGDGTRALRALRPGTRVLLEGPYGAMHGARWTGRKLLLVAGGIGVAPLRALAEALPYQPFTADLVYRARNADDLVFRGELEAIAARRGLRLHVVAGQRGTDGVGEDPLGPAELEMMVPDAAERDIYLCGPNELMDRVRQSLLALGVAPEHIQLERFW